MIGLQSCAYTKSDWILLFKRMNFPVSVLHPYKDPVFKKQKTKKQHKCQLLRSRTRHSCAKQRGQPCTQDSQEVLSSFIIVACLCATLQHSLLAHCLPSHFKTAIRVCTSQVSLPAVLNVPHAHASSHTVTRTALSVRGPPSHSSVCSSPTHTYKLMLRCSTLLCHPSPSQG